uniref:Uncharacterized protein n=1 Tax=Naja naja TaxID=35670 RepID=A0A8C6Y8A9_NAJNA
SRLQSQPLDPQQSESSYILPGLPAQDDYYLLKWLRGKKDIFKSWSWKGLLRTSSPTPHPRQESFYRLGHPFFSRLAFP